jgi:hypothetical protein
MSDINDHETGLKSGIQEKLGRKLKEVYADVVNEPVPDRFLDLLNQLEEAEQSDKKSD